MAPHAFGNRRRRARAASVKVAWVSERAISVPPEPPGGGFLFCDARAYPNLDLVGMLPRRGLARRGRPARRSSEPRRAAAAGRPGRRPLRPGDGRPRPAGRRHRPARAQDRRAEAKMGPLRATVTRRAVAVYIERPGAGRLLGVLQRGRSGRIRPGRDAGLDGQRRRLRRHPGHRRRHRRAGPAPRRTGRPAGRAAAGDRRTQGREAERADGAVAHMAAQEQALQSRLVARASRGERAPVPQAQPSGPIPVVTDFTCPIRGPHDLHRLLGGAPRRRAAPRAAPTS